MTTLWQERGIEVSELEQAKDGTLVDSRHRRPAEDLAPGFEPEEGALTEGAGLVEGSVDLGSVLGTGGSGVVRSATQKAMRREVAVKHIRPDRKKPKAAASILKEAWVGGALAHPNVVPIHDLVRVEDAPAIVMRRIEGTSWLDVIRDPSLRDRLKIQDPIEWHVRVLMQVCNAVHFAHSRGVLHLDLKPENVMIGTFGEVYVVDWGLAVGLEGGPDWLLPVTGVRRILGTPGYMSPEQVVADGSKIGIHTDVYLLGATLHHVVTGASLHRGRNLKSVLYRAYKSTPFDYEAVPSVPEGLAAVLHRATARQPHERYGSAQALKEALEEFLAHRESERLLESAQESGAALKALLADGEAGEAEVQRHFVEARFALAQARQGWPENPEIEPLRGELLSLMFERALELGQVEVAESYLEAMSDPPERYRAELAAARSAREAERQHLMRLRAMEGQLDLAQSQRARRRTMMVMGVLWALVNSGYGYLERAGITRIGYTHVLILAAVLSVTVGPMLWFRRTSLLRNHANLRIWGMVALTFLVVQVLWLAGLMLDIPFHKTLCLTPLFYTFIFSSIAITLDGGLIWSALIQVATAVGCFLWPSWAFELIGFGGAFSVAALAWAWREPSAASDGADQGEGGGAPRSG